MEIENSDLQTDSLTTQLVRLIQKKEIINEDIQACTYFLLDAIVNAIAGIHTDMGKVLMQWYTRQSSPDTGRHVFLTGALVHTLEMDDLHKKSVTHPGCVVVPAAIAVAARNDCSGRQLLEAILYGYEAMCRVGNATGREHYKNWHSTATCGPFGSAMAAGHLLGLTTEQLVWSLGNAGTQSSGLWEFMNSGGMSKHLHAGRAAESGILSADLAGQGFTGPTEILEGRQGLFIAACRDGDLSELLAKPDSPWQLRLTSIKPWPSCRHTHPAIDAALKLHPLINSPVKEIHVHVYQAAQDVCDRPIPLTEYQAKFSLQHCVAMALVEGTIGFDSFDASARDRIKENRDKVRLVVSSEINKAYPHDWGCELIVHLENNETLRTSRQHCKGDPESPLDNNEMQAKASLLLDFAGIAKDEQLRLISYILDLPNQPKVTDLTSLLNVKI
jgi:2-methylcitrate dehydratase PrpD